MRHRRGNRQARAAVCPAQPAPGLTPAQTAAASPAAAMLNPAAVRESFAAVTAAPRVVAGDFYGYLFARSPHLRPMFPPQMNRQNERLFAALVKIVGLLDRPDVLSGYLAQLGRDHRKYGVVPEHYPLVGQALLSALRRHAAEWSPETEDAWAAAYGCAADLMIAGAGQETGAPASWTGEVVRHEMRARDLAVLTVRAGEPLPYQAGQYLTVQTGRWPRVWRPFSIANAPKADGDLLDLHVRAVPGGWVSTALVRDTSPHDTVLLGPAMGEMTPAAADGRDLLCVGAGTGLAPVKALAEAVLAADESAVAQGRGLRRSIHLFHGARRATELYDMPALRMLQASYPWLQIVPVVSDEPRFDGPRGQVPEVAARYIDWLDREAFVAGPPAMVQRTAEVLAAAGFPPGRVHFDAIELGIGAG